MTDLFASVREFPFRWMSAAGVAFAVVPHAGLVTVLRVLWPNDVLAEVGTAFTPLSNVSALLLAVSSVVGLVAIATGFVAATRSIRQRSPPRPDIAVWLAMGTVSLMAAPVLSVFTTLTWVMLWVWIGCSEARRIVDGAKPPHPVAPSAANQR